MKSVFLGEEGKAGSSVSIAMGANGHSPPNDGGDTYGSYFANGTTHQPVDAWIEVWNYAGGSSFRAFVGGDGDKKSLFAFFDSSVVGQDMKQG